VYKEVVQHHNQQNNHVHEDSTNGFIDENTTEKHNASKFKPSITDIFYGNQFALLNLSLFKNVRHKQKLTYCKRCLQFLGEITNLKTKDSIRLWNDTINFDKPGDISTAVFLFPNESLLQNFIFMLRKLQNDFNYDRLGLPEAFKVIFETILSDGKSNYILIQIMDHNLKMLRMTKLDKSSGLITLEKYKTIKLLFKFEETEEQPLVKFWLDNTNINTAQISPQMFKAALNHLVKMSTLIPEYHRTSYGFLLSYIDI